MQFESTFDIGDDRHTRYRTCENIADTTNFSRVVFQLLPNSGIKEAQIETPRD